MSYMMKKRAYYRQFFSGTDSLFRDCWQTFMRDKRAGTLHPASDADVASALRDISAAKIVSTRSPHSLAEVVR